MMCLRHLHLRLDPRVFGKPVDAAGGRPLPLSGDGIYRFAVFPVFEP